MQDHIDESPSAILRRKEVHGWTLTMVTTYYSKATAEKLGRPVGSHGITLRLSWEDSQRELSSNPRASWYIPHSAMNRLFGCIKSPYGFQRVRERLMFVKDEESAKALITNGIRGIYEPSKNYGDIPRSSRDTNTKSSPIAFAKG